MRYLAAIASLVCFAIPASADPSNLIATGRTDTQLHVQWQANGHTSFTLDYLGPEHFSADPTCQDFPPHGNIHETTSDAVIITGLQPSTWYHIHVHEIDSGTAAGSTNVIIVKTRPAGSGFETLGPGSSDYTICGGGDPGGEGCAQVTFTLLPNSQPADEVQVTVVDPASGNDVDTFTAPIGQAVPAPEGAFHLRFSASGGYEVTPAQRGLKLTCGDDVAVRLRFHSR